MKLSRKQLRELLKEEVGFLKKGNAKEFKALEQEYMKYTVNQIVGGYGTAWSETNYKPPTGIAGAVDEFRSRHPEPYGSFITELFQSESLEDAKNFSDSLSSIMEEIMKHYTGSFLDGVKRNQEMKDQASK